MPSTRIVLPATLLLMAALSLCLLALVLQPKLSVSGRLANVPTADIAAPAGFQGNEKRTSLRTALGSVGEKIKGTIHAVLPAPVAEAITGVHSNGYLPWFGGALTLGSITLVFWLLIGSPLGVSGSWEKINSWKAARELDRSRESLAKASREDIASAMMRETMEHFGSESATPLAGNEEAKETGKEKNGVAQSVRLVPWSSHFTFLIMTAIGGLAAAVLQGKFALRADMGGEFVSLFGSGWLPWLVLFAGGLLIGFGTRMSGGCTSGHGLSGVSRLQIGSLLGTASFFGAAILASFALEAVLK